MYLVRGRLTPEVAAALMRAVEAASDALFGVEERDDTERPDPEQRRADALGLIAERAQSAGFGCEEAPVSGSRAERYQVVLHVEPESLRADGEPGMAELEDGTRVSAETSRRLSYDASVVEVVAGEVGRVERAGRRTRSVPPAVRRALEARDRGCRFPGRGLRFTDANHIEHWADGGEATLKSLVLLCRRHHRLVHEEGHRVYSDADGQVVFFAPRGKAIAAARPLPELTAAPVRRLLERNRERGVEPDWRSGMPEWKHDRDVPWVVTAAALEALGSASAPAARLRTRPDRAMAVSRAAQTGEHRGAERPGAGLTIEVVAHGTEVGVSGVGRERPQHPSTVVDDVLGSSHRTDARRVVLGAGPAAEARRRPTL